MSENDFIPTTAQKPPADPCQQEPTHITVNGKFISIQDYLKDPQSYNNSPIPSSYLDTVCQTLSTKTIHLFNLDLTKIYTQKKENFK